MGAYEEHQRPGTLDARDHLGIYVYIHLHTLIFDTDHVSNSEILRSQSTYCFAQLFGIQHYLRLKIEFPGVGNNLEKDIPINITSGMDVPPAVGAVPPPVNLDLPP